MYKQSLHNFKIDLMTTFDLIPFLPLFFTFCIICTSLGFQITQKVALFCNIT